VTKTTNPDGTTTYSYVVVSKVGDQVQSFNETSTVATDVISSGSSSSDGGAQASDGNSSSSSSGLSSGGLIAVVIGGIVFVALLIGFFVFRRRQIHKNHELADSDDDVIESPVLHDHLNQRKGPSTWGVNYEEITSKTDPTQSSTGSAVHRSRRSGSEWEDPVIVAARVPFDRVKIGDLLGKGAYGEVFRGEFRDQEVAVKKLLPDTKKNMKHITDFLSEIRLLAAMEHPHIVHFVGVAWDALSDLMCLTEFMAGGDLRSLLIKYHDARHPLGFDAQKAAIALHIAHGLTYLHSLAPIVLHRDLKSRNILLTSTLEAKLTDFGVSRERSDRTMTAGVGSCLWMAPEVMMGRRYDEKADVFSLGVVLSELDTHELPYSQAKDSQTGAPMMDMAVLQQVSAGRLSVQLSDRLQPSLRYLVTACVGLDPRQRPTAAQALYELQVISRSLK
jgi:serine/threonine-protein kinase TNNI3K